MKCKKMTAFMLAAMMVAGSSMAVFAADGDPANSATGEGTLLPHVNREITAVTLPTEAQVASVFNYNVDPEELIKSAGQLLDGTAVTGNENGVYFANAATQPVQGTVSSSIAADTNNDYKVTVSDLATNAEYKYDGTKWQIKKDDGSYEDATVTIDVKESDNTTAGTIAANDTVTVSGAVAGSAAGASSTSDAVKFEGKNSVDVDVTVTAAVVTEDGKNYITLVEDDAALQAATSPALLMNLKVGNDTKVITSAGTTATAKIEGVPNNFKLDVDSSGSDPVYKYAVKSNASGWKSTTVQLSGKTNKVSVPEGDNALEVPKITLTWSVTKHEAYTDKNAHGNWSSGKLWLAKDSSTGFSTTGLKVEVSDGGTTYKTLASDKYSINDAGWVSTTWDNIVAGIGNTPTGTAYIRVTDGTTRYIFKNGN